MTIDFVRDHAMYAAIFGFFGFVWFGWAQEKPPESWRIRLGIGSGISMLVCLAGVYLAIQHWRDATALDSDNVYQTFGIVVATEIILAGVGSAILAWRGKQQYTAAWIAFVVGIHFVPLVWIFRDSALYLLAALVCIASIAAAFYAKRLNLSVSALTGASVGVILLVFGLRGLFLALT